MASKAQRFREFIRRLSTSKGVSSFADARKLVDDTLNEVEDEMSGIPDNPATWLSDGRMYPVQEDNIRDLNRDVKRLRSKDHHIYIANNGAIRIVQVSTGDIVLEKAGADGKLIPSEYT